MQYYASTVDNPRYGSGNKVLHNVVGGRIGVFEGNGGDLRIGLPLQLLHDGEVLRHTPLRLSVFIEAPLANINTIIAKHEIVRHLLDLTNGCICSRLRARSRPSPSIAAGGRWEAGLAICGNSRSRIGPIWHSQRQGGRCPPRRFLHLVNGNKSESRIEFSRTLSGTLNKLPQTALLIQRNPDHDAVINDAQSFNNVLRLCNATDELFMSASTPRCRSFCNRKRGTYIGIFTLLNIKPGLPSYFVIFPILPFGSEDFAFCCMFSAVAIKKLHQPGFIGFTAMTSVFKALLEFCT